MLEWLNANIGVEWATYIGAGIAIIGFIAGLIWGAKTVINLKQKQTVTKGRGIQAGRDANINNSNEEQ